ncbi:MAG: hypothetical protein KY442_07015, partial [Proteobacteria bacterium]|nr:hypothetical protein [Pseudomonadota bacterium]
MQVALPGIGLTPALLTAEDLPSGGEQAIGQRRAEPLEQVELPGCCTDVDVPPRVGGGEDDRLGDDLRLVHGW